MSHVMEELKNLILSLAIYNMVPQPVRFAWECIIVLSQNFCFVLLSTKQPMNELKILDHENILK